MTSTTSLNDVANKINAVVNRGAWNGSITTSGGSVTIPAGYHNGSGKVTGPTLANLIGSNVTLASAGNLLNGITAYGKNGTKYTGSMTNRGAWNGSISTSGGSVTIPAGYHNGSGKVTGPTLASLIGTNVNCDSNARLLSGYTAYGKNGVKYTGSHTCPTLATLVGSNVTLDNNARMLASYTAYGKNGVKYTGSIANKGNLNWSSSNTTYTVPAGYYSGGTLDSRPSYNAGVTAGKSAQLNGSTLTRISGVAPGGGDASFSFSASVGTYIAAMGADPGHFENFSISGANATLVSNITSGDTPPSGSAFARMIAIKVTANTTVTVNWGARADWILAKLA